jgi:N-acetylmuramoyl-L-alanine amidase
VTDPGFPSPNYGPRRDGAVPELIVLHYTGMADCDAALARLCDPQAEVSAHWLIRADGSVTALVPEAMRAWHAGRGEWQGRGDVNSRSIGIEIDNPGDRPFSEPQMAALERLLPEIMARWSIPPAGVIGHSDMAPDRKRDPGPRFDWLRLARQGLAIWPDPVAAAGPSPQPLATLLDRIGYPAAPADARLAAFRLRFRPWARGPEEPGDHLAATRLAATPLA